MGIPAMPPAAGEQLQGNHKSWNEKDDRADDPHKRSSGGLVGKRANAEHPGLRAVAGIDKASGEDEKR